MKKLLLLIWISIVGILVAGCIGGETDTKTREIFQKELFHILGISGETDTKTLSIIINQSDVSGLSLKEYYFISIPENRTFIFGEGDDSGNVPGMEKYTDALPKGARHIGQSSYWADESGRKVQVLLLWYDSSTEFKDIFVKTLDNYKQHSRELEEKGIEVDDPDIGDYSFYYIRRESQPDNLNVRLYYTYKNYYIRIEVIDKKEKSLDEANRIAKIVENRLRENI